MVNEVRDYVNRQIFSITGNLDSAFSKARLARLRRGIGKKPGELPELWGEFLDMMPESLMSETDEPSYAEWTVYTVLTLWAFHQQGHSDTVNLQGAENRLGCAVRKLIKKEDDEERIRFKLSLVAEADDMEELAYRLRVLLGLLSSENIQLDYVDLAGDLFRFQFEKYADRIRLKWGQDFYRYKNTNDSEKGENNEKE